MSAVAEAPSSVRDAARDLIYREAALLDERRWEEWLALWTDDGTLWMPAWASESELTSDPDNSFNLLYLKGKANLEDRVFRIETGDSFASVPMDRTAHQVSGVLLNGADDVTVHARASWLVQCYGLHGSITRGGWYEYTLRQTGSGLRIAKKKIVMIDDRLAGAIDIYHV